ncbi:MAG: type I-C CRISPR-associated endonuclease Cas1c [Synergistaceae bacterium]|jgi:CRISPR-associated protein Cas1|nr:type I-C CRISPR-associated endonuclease Cas1c [Synergistaceae bacterium]
MKHLLNTLFVTTQRAWLSLDGKCVVLNFDKENKKKYPVHILESIICFGVVNATAPLMGFCASNGVAISFFSERGRYLARVDGPVRGNVLLRRQQYRLADDPVASSAIARNILVSKLANSRNVLLRFARENDPEGKNPSTASAIRRLALVANDIQNRASLDVLRGKEGEAARAYFGVFGDMILNQKESFSFNERSRRPPLDEVNAMLSFIYSLLAHDAASALEGVGLDPSVGYLHRDRPGRPSLALDLMEEFRPWLADRLVLSLINRKQVNPAGFSRDENGSVTMSDETRKTVIAAWHERKQDELTHPFIGEKMLIGLVPHIQARLLARHIRGDLAEYPPFVWK